MRTTEATTNGVMDRRAEEMLTHALSPTESEIWSLLRDGGEYPTAELHVVCLKGYGASSNLWNHVMRLKRKLRPLGWDVECVRRSGRAYYRLAKTPAAPRPDGAEEPRSDG